MPPVEEQEQHDQAHISAEQVAAIASLLVVGAATAATASQVANLLSVPTGVTTATVGLALSRPVHIQGSQPPPSQPASRFQWDAEPFYRAAYIEAASRRVAGNVREGMSVPEAINRERVHFDAHVEAQRNRFTAAREVDRQTRRSGLIVGWYATLDPRTSPECRRANGSNFDARFMPRIGYPGAVHRHCRCKPGPPHRGGASLPSVRKAA